MTNSNLPINVDQANVNGPNIANQNVYNTVSAEHITPSVQGVMDLIRIRDFQAAKHKIDALWSISAKNAEIETMLPLLFIQLDLARKKQDQSYLQKIYASKKLVNDPVFQDILDAIAITAEVLMSGIDTALEYFSGISNPGDYAIDAYYEHVADAEQLIARSNESYIKTNEPALCAVIRGLLFRGDIDISADLAELLTSRFPSFNNSVLKLITNFQKFGEDVGAFQLWLLKGRDYKRIIAITDEAIELLNICQGQDQRIVDITANLLKLTANSTPNLFKVCCKYRSYYEEKHPKIYSALQQDEDLENSLKKDRLKECNQKLSGADPLALDEFLDLLSIQGKAKLNDWHKAGGVLKAQNDFEACFNDIYLLVIMNETGGPSDSEIRSKIKVFQTSFKSKKNELPAIQLHHITESLIEKGLHDLAFLILDGLFDITDIWLSPLCINYLNSLLATNQNSTLDVLFKNIPDKDMTEFLLLCKSNYLKGINDIEGALECLKQAISIDPNSLQNWYFLIGLYATHTDDENEYKAVLSEIPLSIFQNFSEQAVPLIYEILSKGDPEVAESILIRWFIKDPDALSKHVTNISFNLAINKQDNNQDTSVDICLGGFRYKQGLKEFTKLIVVGETSHRYLIASNTSLAKQLISMNPGEEVTFKLNKLKLLEVIPTFACCVQIGISIRTESDDDGDYFIPLEMPTDKAMLLPAMEEIFRLLENEVSHREKYLKTKEVPLFSKFLISNKICPMEVAVAHLSHPQVEKSPFTNIGVDQPEMILLDVYSIAYLGLSGLIHGFIAENKPIVITIETKNALIAYLEQVQNPNYLVAGLENGRFSRTTSVDIMQQTKDIRIAINHVLANSEIPVFNKVDLSQELLQLSSMLDYSVFSTIKLAFTNNIPWLCIDGLYHGLLNQSGISVVNNIIFFGRLGSQTRLEYKLGGLARHGTSSFPFVLRYADLGQLASTDLSGAHYVLSNILSQQQSIHNDANQSICILSQLAADSLVEALGQGQFFKGLRKDYAGNDGYAEKVFNTCCSLAIKIPGWTAEKKLAYFLMAVNYLLAQNKQASQAFNFLANRFIEGHFLSYDEIMSELKKIKQGENMKLEYHS